MKHLSCWGWSRFVPGVSVGPVPAGRPREATWSHTHTHTETHAHVHRYAEVSSRSPGCTPTSIHAHMCTHTQAALPAHYTTAVLRLWEP